MFVCLVYEKQTESRHGVSGVLINRMYVNNEFCFDSLPLYLSLSLSLPFSLLYLSLSSLYLPSLIPNHFGLLMFCILFVCKHKNAERLSMLVPSLMHSGDLCDGECY
eukprot:sb/3477716/